MPHLSFEYSASLKSRVDLSAFAEAMRDAMAAIGVFPLGGVRVRGFAADISVIADGPAFDAAIADGGAWADFLDMNLRMGAGRDAATKTRAAEAIYAAAEAFLKPRIGDAPFALSLEVREIDPEFSLKRYNTIHDALAARAPAAAS